MGLKPIQNEYKQMKTRYSHRVKKRKRKQQMMMLQMMTENDGQMENFSATYIKLMQELTSLQKLLVNKTVISRLEHKV